MFQPARRRSCSPTPSITEFRLIVATPECRMPGALRCPLQPLRRHPVRTPTRRSLRRPPRRSRGRPAAPPSRRPQRWHSRVEVRSRPLAWRQWALVHWFCASSVGSWSSAKRPGFRVHSPYRSASMTAKTDGAVSHDAMIPGSWGATPGWHCPPVAGRRSPDARFPTPDSRRPIPPRLFCGGPR